MSVNAASEINPKALTFLEYQQRSLTTLLYNNPNMLLYYAVLGLNGEAGEVAEHVKKILRDDAETLTPERRDAIIKELGDVMWYVALCCNVLSLDMGEVAVYNLNKLRSRERRGVLGGSGDSR